MRNEDNFIGARVLIADDDKDFRQMLVRRAEKLGLSVVEAEDGVKAIEALDRYSFDLLIVDLYMPGKDGLDVIQSAQHVDPELRAIVITGSGTLETAVEALRARVYDYLAKPLEALAIFDMTVKRALRQRFLERENERLFSEIQRLATTDPLTGLYNRHKLNDVVQREVERAKRYGRPLALIMFDLDGMKPINDKYGHPVGDKALRMVGQAIQNELRRMDFPARIGGDEFVALLPEAGVQDAVEVAERILTQLSHCKIHGHTISVSVGVAELRPTDRTPEDLIQAADQALYRSKRAGGKRISVMKEKVEHEQHAVT